VSGKGERQTISGSFENEAEAQAVVTLVQELQRASSSHHHKGGGWSSADRIRIITFYSAQVALLKRLLQQKRLGDVVVATVDSSQGCEADVVIVSFVRSMGSAHTSGRTNVGFLSDDRRMNVALTRGEIVVAFLLRMNSFRLD
jgi:superfamily I DNA and/or RNA helicase